MTIYTLKVNPNYTTQQDVELEFEDAEDLREYLENVLGYDDADEIEKLILEGGKYIGLKDTEFEIIIEEVEEEEPEQEEEEKEEEEIEPKEEEKTEEVPLPELVPELNSPDFKYYIISSKEKAKILKGFEYKEDAKSELEEIESFGEKDLSVVSKKDLASVGIDPNNNDAWDQNIRDWEIIKSALFLGTTKGDYSEKRSEELLAQYKEGKFSHIIKTSLVHLLAHHRMKLESAYTNSDKYSIRENTGVVGRIERELKKVLLSEPV